MNRLRSLLMLLLLSPACGGCTMLVPADETSKPFPLALKPSESTEQFDAIARAQQDNAIVLQVNGAETPLRILPLPPDGQPVYVSDLLRQSGLTADFPQMRAVLYRNSPEVIGGIRMGIRFRSGTNVVAPEHDYYLRPGDRLQVAEVQASPFGSLMDEILPTNARRATIGF